ncbi:PREDICTED: cyclin-D4-1-like [Tarenaya hassleriana]|uniref:cyclin-D4-1-like n=1 Tax=Tarenaya hassleriana TaxID=28532 RepID=UPI00053C9D6E|nr:PREDICTED: cyclin-D4-1-like [Tarenaya hassleriana]
MAPSFDCAAFSRLLCSEDDGVFDSSDNYEATSFLSNHRAESHRDRNFHGGNVPPPLESEEVLCSLISKEPEHLPKDDYSERLRNGDLDLVGRAEAIDWICKVHTHFGFGPLCAYLSINYMDRFLSSYELPKGKAWMMQLLAVACLSLAAKMEETEVPLSLDLQVGESKFVFEARTIQRMELLVLGTLQWRMQAVTPFSFLDYFHSKIDVDPSLQRFTIFRSIQLISSAFRGIHFLEFKPSEIAAAAVISSAEEIHVALDREKALSDLSPYVSKERLLKCKELIQGQGLTGFSSLQFAPKSPNGVLEASCLSFRSDESSSLVGSRSSSPVIKRRRLNRSCEAEAMIN